MSSSLTTRHCRELDRCNQRGGRMLSVLDLLDAHTLDLDLAAYLMARTTRGASFMVGARPGGAGQAGDCSHKRAGGWSGFGHLYSR